MRISRRSARGPRSRPATWLPSARLTRKRVESVVAPTNVVGGLARLPSASRSVRRERHRCYGGIGLDDDASRSSLPRLSVPLRGGRDGTCGKGFYREKTVHGSGEPNAAVPSPRGSHEVEHRTSPLRREHVRSLQLCRSFHEKISADVLAAENWVFWSDGRDLIPYCAACSKREFGGEERPNARNAAPERPQRAGSGRAARPLATRWLGSHPTPARSTNPNRWAEALDRRASVQVAAESDERA
jgi:hypothetical protein